MLKVFTLDVHVQNDVMLQDLVLISDWLWLCSCKLYMFFGVFASPLPHLIDYLYNIFHSVIIIMLTLFVFTNVMFFGVFFLRV